MNLRYLFASVSKIDSYIRHDKHVFFFIFILGVMVFNGSASLMAQTYFSPEEGKDYCIRQNSSGLVIGNDSTLTDGAKLFTLDAKARDQSMMIIPINNSDTVLIKNENDRFLSRVTNTWSLGFVDDNGYIDVPSSGDDKLRFLIQERVDQSGVYEIYPVNHPSGEDRLVATDNLTSGSPIYSDKASSDKAYWKIVDASGLVTSLASLSVSVGALKPTFISEVTDYTLTVTPGTSTVEISADAFDNSAILSITNNGSIALVDGLATAIVTVTLGNNETLYTLNIQESDGNYANFEDDDLIPLFSHNDVCQTLQIINNPDKTGYNTTDKVLHALSTNSKTDWWRGIELDFGGVDISENTRYLHVFMRTNLPKFEWMINTGSDDWRGAITSHPVDTWFDQVVDLNNLNKKTISYIRLSLACDATAGLGKDIYIDEILFNNDSVPRIMVLNDNSDEELSADTVVSYADFEDEGITPDYSDNGVCQSLEVLDNPDKTELNKTNKSLYAKTLDGDSDWWRGIELNLGEVFVADSTRYLHILMRTNLPKFEWNINTGSDNWQGAVTSHSKENIWFDHVIDLKDIKGKTISYIRVALSCNEEAQRNKILYLDEIIFNNESEARSFEDDNSEPITVNSVIIDASQSYQTIVGFAASDCWTSNFVGQWEGTGKEEIAKYLFSQELDENGSPEGIGLSMWRVNIGAGTLEQGDDSGIDDVSRRTECLLDNSTGEYDWSKQSGQQFFMQKAKEYGCESFVAFSNSPPLSMTRNGKGYAPGDNQANLKSDKYDDFADFLTTVIKHFNNEGYNFSYVSPVNEPQYDWKSGGQEGTSWQNSEITKLVKEVNTSIVNKELNSKILISEGAEWKYLYEGDVSKRYNQTWAFFGENQTDTYVGDLASVPALIGGHSYWNHGTNTELRDAREKMKAKAEEFNVDVFQTEWSLLGENPGENFPGYDVASYMDIALIQARMIHADMTIANVTSWSYWTAMDMERWGHKNRFLMIAVKPNNTSNPENEEALTTEGTYSARANLWAMGNYSYFIRPGYKRIAYTGPDDLGALMGSAYLAPDSSEIVAVYVNIDESDYNLKTTINGIDNFKVKSNQAYLTNEINALKKMSIDESYSSTDALKIPARSVLTMVYKLEKTELSASLNKVVNPNSVVIYPNPTQGKFHVKLKGDDLKKDNILKIYDNTGRLLYSELLESKETEISFLAKAHNGIYYINAFNQLTKLVKAK